MEQFFVRSRSTTRMHPSIFLARKKVYAAQLDENEVLELCDIFLKPGIHGITFTSLTVARKVVDSFIEHLTCYHAIGYIDRIGAHHHKGLNLYEFFAHYSCDEQLGPALEIFFLEQFCYDFIWIVYPKYQVATTFIQKFLDGVLEFQIDRKIPIVFVSS